MIKALYMIKFDCSGSGTNMFCTYNPAKTVITDTFFTRLS